MALNRYLHPSTYISALKELSTFPETLENFCQRTFSMRCVPVLVVDVVPQSHKRVHAFIKLNWITTYKKLYHHGAAFHPFVDEQKLCFECSESYLVLHIEEREREMMKKLWSWKKWVKMWTDAAPKRELIGVEGNFSAAVCIMTERFTKGEEVKRVSRRRT